MKIFTKRNARGFTLLELLVVLSLFFVVIGIVINATAIAKVRGRDSHRVATMKDLRTALENYRAYYGQYPQCLAPVGSCVGEVALTNSPIMKNVPTTDSVGEPFMYTAFADLDGDTPCTGFHIGIQLEERNSVNLKFDVDLTTSSPVCGNSLSDFSGLSRYAKGFRGDPCSVGVTGQAAPASNPNLAETCYDFIQPY